MVETAARVATTEPSFEVATETLCDLTRVVISKTTVWQHHKEVTSRIQAELEKEEQEIPYWVLWNNAAAMEWIRPEDPVEHHASVSIDGLTVLIREEGYREVKMVSVSEVVETAEEEVLDAGEESREETGGREEHGPAHGREDDLKLTRHSYRAVLGDKATFAPALKGELARRRVRDGPLRPKD